MNRRVSRPAVVSFWTDKLYQNYSRRLRRSVCGLKWPCMIGPLQDLGAWYLNCGQKPRYILACMESTSRNVVWIDADGDIVREPTLLMTTEADFGIYGELGPRESRAIGRGRITLPENWPSDEPPRWFKTGTIYFRNCEASRVLLRRWDEIQQQRPRDWDQWTLQRAWCDVRPSTVWLPQAYCKIEHMRWRRGEGPHTIIRHQTASVRKGVDRG